MKITVLPVGMYQTNCYLLEEQEGCLLIDPGEEYQKILGQLTLPLKGIALTHGHFDHVGAVKALAEKFNCPVYLHPGDRETGNAMFYPLRNWEYPQLRLIREGDEILCAGLTLSVLSTPGHTPGSVCYLCEDALFSGDTLFAGSCGRTDLPGGNGRQLLASLARLRELPEGYKVFPGHGEATALSREIRYNPYMVL